MYKTLFQSFLSIFILHYVFVSANVSPRIAEIISKYYLSIDTKLKVVCQTLEGSKPIQYEWHKNGKILNNFGHSGRIETSEDDSLLVIEKASLLNSGNYSCTARNDFGTDTRHTEIVVKGLLF